MLGGNMVGEKSWGRGLEMEGKRIASVSDGILQVVKGSSDMAWLAFSQPNSSESTVQPLARLFLLSAAGRAAFSVAIHLTLVGFWSDWPIFMMKPLTQD